jgi:hypothetical protein
VVGGGTGTDIVDNDITATTPSSANCIGVRVDGGATGILIERNRIFGGLNAGTSAVRLQSAIGLRVINNLLHAGDTAGAAGIECDAGSAIVANNTLYVGNGTGLTALSGCQLTVVNNVLFGVGGWRGYTADDTSGVLPTTFENNVFLSSNPPLAYVEDPTHAGAGATLAASIANLCGAGVPASGNLELSAPWSTLFAGPVGGTDGNIDSLADEDWRFAAAQTALHTMGKDASQMTCGGTMSASCSVNVAGSASCGGVVDDFTGTARNGVYSIGAQP